MFNNIDEVKNYLSGNKIECLECGKMFEKLGIHLSLKHGMSKSEYCKKNGIPTTYSLCGKSFKRYISGFAKERRLCGDFSTEKDMENLKKATSGKRFLSPAVIGIRSDIGKKTVKKICGSNKIEDDKYYELLNKIKTSGVKRSVLFGKDGYPCKTAFYKKIREDQHFRTEYYK